VSVCHPGVCVCVMSVFVSSHFCHKCFKVAVFVLYRQTVLKCAAAIFFVVVVFFFLKTDFVASHFLKKFSVLNVQFCMLHIKPLK